MTAATLLIAGLSAIMPVIAVLVTFALSTKQRHRLAQKQRVQMNTIEVLVNGRMSAALARIAELESLLGLHPEEPAPDAVLAIPIKQPPSEQGSSI